MLSIRECAAVQVVDQGSCSLVAALSRTIDRCYVLLSGIIDCLHCLHEVLCCPGMCLKIQILHSICSLKHSLVDCHTMCYHTQRILIVSTVSRLTCRLYGIVDLAACLCCKQVRQVYHQAACAPVSYQTLRSFHYDVRSLAAFDRGVNLIVTVGVIKILHCHGNAGIFRIKTCDQAVNRCRITPVTDGICPQCDRCIQICTCAVLGGCFRLCTFCCLFSRRFLLRRLCWRLFRLRLCCRLLGCAVTACCQ